MKRGKALLWSALLLILTGGSLAFLLRGVDWPAVGDVLQVARLGWLLCGLGLMALFVCAQAASLSLLLGRCGQKIGLGTSLRSVFIGFFFSGITPSASGGQPAQVWQLSRQGVSAGASAGALLLMQISYQAVMVALGALGLLLCGGAFAEAQGGIWALLIYGFAAAAAVFFLLFLALFSGRRLEKTGLRFLRFLGRRGLLRCTQQRCDSFRSQMAQFDACAALLRQNGWVSLALLALTAVEQISRLAIPCAVYAALGLTGHPLWQLAAAQAVLAVAVDTLPLPGAAGASEGVFLAVQGFFFGPLAVPAMLLCRGISFYAAMAVSGIVTALPIPAGRRLEQA